MYKRSLAILLTIFTTVALGQKTNPVASFVKNFKPYTLPICIYYSYDEQVYFGAIYHTDTVSIHENDTTYTELEDVYEKTDNYQKDTSLLLDPKLVKQYLLADTENLYSEFYPVGLIIENKKIYGVIYERLFTSGDIPSSEKYLCTISKTGKYISGIMIASFIFSGTGTSISGARFPWFPEETSCLNKDLIIKFSSNMNGDKKYTIQKDGQIIEIK